MEQVIKFRGMTTRGDWVYGLLCHDKTKDKDFEWFISNGAGKPYAYGIRPETIGQYTGLKDKEKVEIYVGDILTFPDTESHHVDVGVGDVKVAEVALNGIASVVLRDYSFGLTNIDSQESLIGYGFISFAGVKDELGLDELEVVGNIYENKGLIK